MTLITTASLAQEVSLEWNFFHPIKKEWLQLGEKGSIQEALIRSGDLPDPFYGLNETKFGWIEEHEWEFKSILVLNDAHFEKENIELIFPSIDTYGRIYVNDSLVGKSQNAFIPHSFQAKKYLKPGVNEIHVVIVPPVLYHADRWNTEKYHLPAPNDVHDTAIAPYTRKPQYQFGWDWSLRMNTIGMNKVAYAIAYNDFRVINHSVQTVEFNDREAIMQFDVYINNHDVDSIQWGSELFGMKVVQVIDGRATRYESIISPKLWWPRGYGEQIIYTDNIKIQNTNNEHISNIELNFGIKTSELIQEADEWGTSYYFKINGQRIFAKGANYIPQDIFPSRITEHSIEKYVQDMAESNFNMVRVWGGGFYQEEAFYDACDRSGILVWQDLMFACAMYRGDDEFIVDVRKEFEYQIPRISKHPSVALFNGNNEVEVAWGNWGFQIKYGLYGKSAQEIEEAYDRLFKQLAPEVITATCMIPYIHTSPLSNWGKNEFYNHGSQHYWGVWHGKDPMEDFGKKIGRFNAEYGFQSFPEYSTLKTFSAEKDWDISSDVMKQHQKSYVGNEMIMKHAKRLYGEPKNFEEFVYFSQLTQAMAVSMAIGGHRIDAPRCGGTLFWQLNDCWPVSSWSSIDYFGNWKALQYKAREDYEDITVLAKYNDLTNVDYYMVNELPGEHSVELEVVIKDLNGKELDKQSFQYHFNNAGKEKIVIDTVMSKCKEQKNKLIQFTWKLDSGKTLTRSYDQIHKEYQKASVEDVKLTIEKIDVQAKTAILEINTKEFVRNLWISSNEFGVRFENNFLSYLPGKHKVKITFEQVPTLEQFKLIWN